MQNLEEEEKSSPDSTNIRFLNGRYWIRRRLGADTLSIKK
jgi:hypothetical protein